MAGLRYCAKCKDLASEIKGGDGKDGLLYLAAAQRAGSEGENVCDMCGKPLRSSSSAALGCLMIVLLPVGWMAWSAAQTVRNQQVVQPAQPPPVRPTQPAAQSVPSQVTPLATPPAEMPSTPVVATGPETQPVPAESADINERAHVEMEATAKLKLARTVLLKQEDAGKRRLREIIEKYPGTEAALEAEKLLAK